jgi:hypothetical protein
VSLPAASQPVWVLYNNREFIPNFGERRRQGETISTAFVESTINQVVSRRFVKKQQMQWTLRGAHLLLQTRTRVLNEDLDNLFRRCPALLPARSVHGSTLLAAEVSASLHPVRAEDWEASDVMLQSVEERGMTRLCRKDRPIALLPLTAASAAGGRSRYPR